MSAQVQGPLCLSYHLFLDHLEKKYMMAYKLIFHIDILNERIML